MRIAKYIKIKADNRERKVLREFEGLVGDWSRDSRFSKDLTIDFSLADPDCTGNLELGDYINIAEPLDGQRDTRRILVERKTWNDLKDTKNSTGSRQTQLMRLVESLEKGFRPALFITGQMEDILEWERRQEAMAGRRLRIEERHISEFKGLRKYLMSYMRFNVYVFQQPDLNWFVHDLITLFSKGFPLTLREIPTVIRGGPEQTIVKVYMAGMDDLGPVLAGTLAEAFPNLHELFKASDEEIMELPGFGEGRTAIVRKFINQEFD
jgi:hypothetical protein